MASYQSTNCGSCGVSWQNMSATHDTNIGPPYIKCRHCNSVNKTEMYLYRDANWFGKLYYWFSISFSTLLFGVGSIIAGIGFIRSILVISIVRGFVTWFGFIRLKLFDSSKYFKYLKKPSIIMEGFYGVTRHINIYYELFTEYIVGPLVFGDFIFPQPTIPFSQKIMNTFFYWTHIWYKYTTKRKNT